MEGRRLIQSIRLENILSFGPDVAEFPLEPLNVFIGPNASGKSNLIEVLSLLHAAPSDLQEPIRRGGGVRDWLWKGVTDTLTATVEVTVENPKGQMALRYRLSFTEAASRFDLRDEAVENERPQTGSETPYFYYRYDERGHPVINVLTTTEGNRDERRLIREDVRPDQSILSQRRDPDSFPELTYMATQFDNMRFYRELDLKRDAPVRLPQKPDLPQDFLMEDAWNLGVVLSPMLNQLDVKERILERMRDFYPSFREVTATVDGGAVQIFFHEKGLLHPVPATRLSDGSLRYLCLLAMLCHPNLRGVVCIEEPELGLHPDAQKLPSSWLRRQSAARYLSQPTPIYWLTR